MKESDILEPMSYYAATKAASTIMSQTFARLHKKPIVTLRPFSVYGPYEEAFRFIPTIFRCVTDKIPLPLTKGSVRHDFVYIDDLLDACMRAFEKGSQLSGQIINIGSGKQYTNDQVVKMAFTAMEKRTRIMHAGFTKRRWDSPYWVADVTRSQRILGWRARTSLAMGLKKTYRWFAANRNLYA